MTNSPNVARGTPPGRRRRAFLQSGLGALAMGLASQTSRGDPSAANGAMPPGKSGSGKAKTCILVYLLGGPSHLDMWDLKPRAPAEIRGPFQPIATNVAGLQICEHLPRLAARADRYALVRSVTHPNDFHTHMIYYTLASDKIGAIPDSDPIDPTDIHATMYHALGIDGQRVVRDHLDRPIPLCTGKPIASLF